MAMPPLVLIMGVSGCGKSSVGERLAQALGVPFIEGDRFHSAANVERMRQGIALTDDDRAAWLQTLADKLAQAREDGSGAVLACSALKRRYRDVLRDGLRGGARDGTDDGAGGRLAIVALRGEPSLLEARMRSRQGHYMPASLLSSQLAAYEPPGADEAALTLDVARPLDELVAEAVAHVERAFRGSAIKVGS